MWLFGSYAKNEQRAFSDIDVALIADEFEGIGYIDTKLFAGIRFSNDEFTLIEPRTYNSNVFTSNIDPFTEIIKTTGIKVF